MSQLRRSKTFWQKPEGKVGGFFILAITGLLAYFVIANGIALASFLLTSMGTVLSLAVLGILIFLALDSKARSVFGYMYQSLMRWITGLFVKIDPLSILKGYVEDMRYNLKKLNIQIGKLRSEKHQLMETIHNNRQEIQSNMQLASEARKQQDEQTLVLKSRKAGRLKDSNIKLSDLLKKMEIMQRVLTKMRDNTHVLVEDTEDQIKIKEQEYKAIMASHSAMKSAMNIIKGDKDKKAMFDQAMEVITEDVSTKVGEMESFMDLSEDFMKSMDIQNGIFEAKGLEMLEKWEQNADSLLLGEAKHDILADIENHHKNLVLEENDTKEEKSTNEYKGLFD